MKTSSRRAFFTSAATAGAALSLAGCGMVTVANTKGVKSITLDMTKLDIYGNDVINGAKTLLSIPAISLALGANASVAVGLMTAVGLDLQALDKQSNGSVNFTLDTTSAKAAFSSLLADNEKLLSLAQTAVADAGIKSGSNIITLLDAVETLVVTIKGFAGTMAAAPTKMSVAKAISVIEAAPKANLH